MAEKKKTGSAKVPVPDKMKEFKGDILTPLGYDVDYLKQVGLLERTIQRKIRFWCYKFRSEAVDGKKIPKPPTGLKKFIEGLPGFAGWEHFAISWDIYGTNPFMIVLRLQSVWDDWDQVMNRVAIPYDAPPEQIHARIEALTDEYARKQVR